MARFKLDENVPIEAAPIIRDAGHDVMTVLDQQMEGATDAQLATVCVAEARSILTLDLDFADIRAYPPEQHAGIVVLRLGRQDKQSVLAAISQLMPQLEVEPLVGKLWIVDEQQIRIRG